MELPAGSRLKFIEKEANVDLLVVLPTWWTTWGSSTPMRDMNMAADAAWTATVDSLRRDLVGMPEMSGAELQSFMPAHQARLERLMQMHRAMMGGMKM